MLDEDTRRELRSLSKDTAELVARHLVVTGQLIDDDPEQALTHARAARALAGRIGVVRQAAGLAAYAAGEWNEALSELRAARRITGRPEHLAVMADCERALERPERALAYADDPEVPSLSQDERVELVIVLAGARRDMGQLDAAVLALQDPARRTTAKRPWAARLWYAYADALLTAGREPEAREWFARTADVDADGQTDAADRVLALDGIVLEDLGDDDADGAAEGMDDAALAAYVAEGFTPVGLASPAAEAVAERVPASPVVAPESAASAPEPEPSGSVPQVPESSASAVPAPAGLATGASALAGPFSDELPAAESATVRRPAAALVPTFAAPQDEPQEAAPVDPAPEVEAAEPASSDTVSTHSAEAGPKDDGDELTLFG